MAAASSRALKNGLALALWEVAAGFLVGSGEGNLASPVGLMSRKGLALGGDGEENFPFFLGWNPESPRFRNEKKAHFGPFLIAPLRHRASWPLALSA